MNDMRKRETVDKEGNGSTPEIQVDPPAVIEWDKSQLDVINAPQEDRLLVGAGPGTGKTAVACARVSQLIDRDGLEPSRVWLISFTRTAVREIRDRISTYLEDASAAYAVKIATLDSHAWSIHSGFDDEARILGTYEENIERVLKLVQQDVDVLEYLESIEHLVVDEAQDIVGIRSDLVVEIVGKLPSTCGVTVFADEAQAIYGFADDHEVHLGEAREPSFPEKIRRGMAGKFMEHELVKVHRTSSPQLLGIFSDTRRKVLATATGSQDKLAEIKEEITNRAHGEALGADDTSLAELEDAFILYRRRCDVLLTSSLLTQNGIRHRVRMSGLPVCLEPWIGATLSEHGGADLGQDTFRYLWSEKVSGTILAIYDADDAWERLVRISGHTPSVVDMRRLRQRLGRKQPPAELCHPELGLHGPIIGTIHASKGREADTVHLMLPKSHHQDIDEEEESRVVFVGATRSRSRLLVGKGYRQPARRIEASGRSFCLKINSSEPRAQVEIGRDNDIVAAGLAGRSYFTSPDEVHISQKRISELVNNIVPVVAESDRNAEFAYRLKENGRGQCLAVLSRTVNSDLFKVANILQEKLGGGKRRPPNKIQHLHVRGVRTVVLPPDAPEGEALHEPWRSSGIMLAPLVLGYSTPLFPLMNRRRRW